MLTLQRPRDLLAERIVLQPYGFWHRPAVRAAVIGAGLMLGVLAGFWLLAASADGSGEVKLENETLRAKLEAAAKELDAERFRAAELARDRDALARELQRVREPQRTRDDGNATQQKEKAAKRRERRPEPEEASATRSPQAIAVPQAIAAPQTEPPAATSHTE